MLSIFIYPFLIHTEDIEVSLYIYLYQLEFIPLIISIQLLYCNYTHFKFLEV